jgi:hypothetical protein
MTQVEYVVIGVVSAAVLLFVLAVLPRLVIPELPQAELASIGDPKDRLTLRNERVRLRNEFRTTCVSFIGGLGLIASVLVAFGQFRSSQDALVRSAETSEEQLRVAQEADRNQHFVDAVENLGSANFAVRVAAVEVLDDFAQYGENQAVEVNSILRAFVGERSPWPPPKNAAYPVGADTSTMPRLTSRSPEINLALRRLGERALADVRTTFIERADLRRADLRDNDYTNAYFGDVHLGSSDLSDADFTGASFDGADLSLSNLTGAKLCGADLSKATLTGATLTGAVADDQTTWPDGFEAEAAGVTQATGEGCVAESPATPAPAPR